MHMLSNNDCYMLIDKPRRVGNNSNTIIDPVITNNTSNITYLAIFTSHITDHFTVGCFVAHSKISTERVKFKMQSFFIRDMRRFNEDKFLTNMVELINYFLDTNDTSSI